MVRKKTITEKIEKAKDLSIVRDYEGAVKELGIDIENATSFELNKIADLVSHSMKKIAEKRV